MIATILQILNFGEITMKKHLPAKQLFGAIFLSLAIASLQAKTYATIDGKPAVTDKDLELIKKINPSFNYSKLSDQEKEGLINQILINQLILKDAKAQKLDASKEYTEAINNIKDQFLVELWQKKQVDNAQVPKLTDAQLRDFYKNNEGMFIKQEMHARHILVKTESEAKDIIKELDKAGKKAESKFIELANAKSIDPASKQTKNGGDLGTFQRNVMHPDFANAASNLKPGTYTQEPVQTPFGYHIIYLIKKGELKVESYNEAKPKIEELLKGQSIQSAIMQKIQALYEKAKIQITK